MPSFRHAGDKGDIIYSLPAVRAMGGGAFFIEAASWTREQLTPDKWCGIDKLLRMQPYIASVSPWVGGRADVNLSDFRATMNRALRARRGLDTHLADWVLDHFGMDRSLKDQAWLTVDATAYVADVIINRSGPGRPQHQVYHNSDFPWHAVWEAYGNRAAFIGTPLEYQAFCRVCGKVPYYETKDLADAARAIAGCKLFVGNQSCPHAIAEGMKKNIVLEVWRGGPNCLVFREGVTHGWDHDVKLPDL